MPSIEYTLHNINQNSEILTDLRIEEKAVELPLAQNSNQSADDLGYQKEDQLSTKSKQESQFPSTVNNDNPSSILK